MPQLLELLKKGNRITPTVYQFGRNERLNIHAIDSYADLTDASSGSYIRQIGWDGLRDMGYSPEKLLSGNSDQSLDSPLTKLLEQVQSYALHALGGLAVAVVISIVGAVTGCTNYVLDKAEKDVATSTIYPRVAAADDDEVLLNFKKDNAHANKQLNAWRATATGGVK